MDFTDDNAFIQAYEEANAVQITSTALNIMDLPHPNDFFGELTDLR